MSTPLATEIPKEFLCPIRYQAMTTPTQVNCSGNHRFQSETIRNWTKISRTCPLDGESISEMALDRDLQEKTSTFIQNNPHLFWLPNQSRGKTVAEIVLENTESPSAIPETYLCPITLQIMTRPGIVDCNKNHRFHEGAIKQALKKKKECPIDRNTISTISPDKELQQKIRVFIQLYPGLFENKNFDQIESEINNDLKATAKASSAQSATGSHSRGIHIFVIGDEERLRILRDLEGAYFDS